MEYCQTAFLLGANCGVVQIPVADTTAFAAWAQAHHFSAVLTPDLAWATREFQACRAILEGDFHLKIANDEI
jgi:hypothetical protein